ncbi:DNA mismatch repair protein MutS [Convivina intestini]|uniref:DNA mismatch repair protein MutS n=1 Tax=Convivina intestini TaxID=1505726 RepID=UPI00200C3CAD|nr:DNA mismatch repair protein MutS [Convivina intestini]CAH1850204.1 DNA mismatch repair protein MutS [Convivina intestini]
MPKNADTPMMEQYHQIKKQYPDAFVFYRLGDFFELFEDDAILGAKLLELTLTSRNKNSKNPVPMAGIPHHAAQNYIDILVDQGYKVAIVEQMEDPAAAKGMVKRDVVQLVTPGTKLNGQGQDGKENNYLAALYPSANGFSLSYLDLSTGELKVTSMTHLADALDELSSIEAKEVVLLRNDEQTTQLHLADQLGQRGMVVSHEELGEASATISYLINPLDSSEQRLVTTLLLQYLFETQRRNLDHIVPAQAYERLAYLRFNQATRLNLDLVENARTKKKSGSLLGLIDQSKTAMGGRLLKQWLLRPLRTVDKINERLDLLTAFTEEFFVRGTIQDQLKSVYDLERLAARAAMGSMNARELVQLKRSLRSIPSMKTALEAADSPLLKQAGTSLDGLVDLADLIEAAIVDDPPISVREGDLIKDGYEPAIDQYRSVLKDNQDWLASFEKSERQATGISSLKVGYNKNFGYFLEVTKANIPKLAPDRYERRQTLTNAERFVTPELKEHESLIVEAQAKRTEREYQVFTTVRDQVKAEIKRLQQLAQQVARLDVLAALADVAEQRNYVRPTFYQNHAQINIRQGRHPVIESLLGPGEFVANDVIFDEKTNIQLITGPNMAGKSTYMRELALIVVMAQIGSFVPADQAQLPVFDQIFTRIGANDDLVNGQSTFMVEMAEANLALQEASAHSLILFDELGRGTATYDGMALAQAIIEYLDQHIHAKTLFSTHYHELTVLADRYPDIENVHVGAEVDDQGKLHFLHQVQKGPADRSYGIHVAALAGLPQPLIQNATTILSDLEAGGSQTVPVSKPVMPTADNLAEEIPLFTFQEEPDASQQVLKQLDELKINELTPLEALNTLNQLQKMRLDNGQNS